MTAPERLPELPEPELRAVQEATDWSARCVLHGYTAAQMHAYARQAIAESEARAEGDARRLDWIAMNGRSIRHMRGRNTTLIQWASCIPTNAFDPRVNIRIAIDTAIQAQEAERG